MKRFLVIITMLLMGLPVLAKEEQILVLPLFMTSSQNYNAYGFETASEIVSGDIIQNFLLGHKINTAKLESVKAFSDNDYTLLQTVDKFKRTGVIDFDKVVSVANKNPNYDKTLLVASYVKDKNGDLLEVWNLLKFATDFNLTGDYVLTTKVILVDNADGVALWQKTYELPLSSKRKPFVAKDYAKAVEQFEKVHSYSKNIISKDVEENLNVRLSGKTINFSRNNRTTSPTGQEGIGLKYIKREGIPGLKITEPAESFEDILRRDDSFSL